LRPSPTVWRFTCLLMHRSLKLGDKTADMYRKQTVPFRRDNSCQFRPSPAAFSTPHKAFRPLFRSSSRSSATWSGPAVQEPICGAVGFCQLEKSRGAEFDHDIAEQQVPSPEPSTNWPRIFSPATFPPLSRTLRRSSRISKINPRPARLMHRSHTIIGGGSNEISQLLDQLGTALQAGRSLHRNRHTLRRPSSSSNHCRTAECKRSLRRCLVRTALHPMQ
jgi:hypothetical protein